MTNTWAIGRALPRLRQLGDVCRDPPRLVLGEQLGCRAPAGLLLEIVWHMRSTCCPDKAGFHPPHCASVKPYNHAESQFVIRELIAKRIIQMAQKGVVDRELCA